ncbi:50S ribosomal protein L24 [Candidatus Peribacteria bacterium]|nr:50S ribosomal protein L24 [Candidatus Peribacteria bacterium]
MKLCVNDPVIVIAGKDAGKEGTVMRVDRKHNRVVVEGVNKQIRHKKRTMGEPGRREEFFAPLDASNVMYKDPKTGKPTRLGYKIENGAKIRIAKKSGTEVPPQGKGTFTTNLTA